jgi:hypothetical protein
MATNKYMNMESQTKISDAGDLAVIPTDMLISLRSNLEDCVK